MQYPNLRQIDWYERRTAFFHFSMNTFTDREWGQGDEDLSLFAPTDLDCRQWIRSIRKAGFTSAIIVAKHHDGLCLWNTKTSAHNVMNTSCGQDVVKLFTEACAEYGITAGVYISPWDRNCPLWGSDAYSDYYHEQLTELLTNYGEIREVWWDGAGSTETRYDWEKWVKTIRRLQPNAVIFGSLGAAHYVDVRWVGNERGLAGDSCFATINESSLAKEIVSELNRGDPDGDRFVPAECDMSIRPGWFYHPEQDNAVKSPGELVDYWFTSAGRNCGVLLNFPPDRRGLLHEKDVASAIEWNERLKRAFSNDLAGKTVQNGNSFETYFEKTEINCYRVSEDIRGGERVLDYTVEALAEDGWTEIAHHECIGHLRCEHFSPVTACALRVNVLEAADTPLIGRISVYRIPDGVFEKPAREKITGSLTDLKTCGITQSGDETVVNFGGVYPYDHVEFDSDDGDGEEVRVLRFNGTRFKPVFEGKIAGTHKSCDFNTVKDSYQLMIVGKNVRNIRVTEK